MLDYSKVRFLWRGDAGRKVSSGRYDKIYDMGPRAATGDASFSTAATRPLVDELGPYYGLNVGQIQNAIRNNSMVGAVAGTPGTLPTNYTGAQGGLTREIIGTGTENGVDYIEIKYSGTATGTVASLVLEGSTQIVATPSQVWTFSSFFKSVSGSPNSYLLRILERTDAGVYVTDSASSALSVTSTLSRFSFTRTNSANVTTARVQPQIDFVLTNGASYDFTIRIGLPQMELGAYAKPVIRTTGTAVASVGTASQIVDAIPATGSILVWDNLVNAYPTAGDKAILGSENLSTTFVSLVKDATNTNQLNVRVHNNTEAVTTDLLWQASNAFKRWFFAMTFNGSTVELWRGDIQGNITKVLSTAYTPGTAAIRDLFLASTATPDGQTSDSFLDIMTYDAVMTAEQIQNIYYGTIPVFQQTGYAGTFVDKYRQKVQAEPSSTYDTTLESTVLADWSEDIFGVYDADASAFFSRGFEDGATLENLDATNTFILALKAL